MQEKLKDLTPYYGLSDYWKEKVKTLEKKDINFNIMDLDDTLFSTKERRESDIIFQENRGEKGNILTVNTLGLAQTVKTHYQNKILPRQILDTIDPKISLILTAGVREYQEEKVQYLGLNNFTVLVTETAKDKIIALIRYIIFDLKYIPSKITVYEDRPQYFVEYRDLLEDIFRNKIKIMYVVMDGNRGYKKIEEI